MAGDSERKRGDVASPERLPAPGTSFVGRAADLTHLFALLDDRGCRLITLSGPGGVGKTRLAIEVARQAGGRFADGVVFVDLQSVLPADLLPVAIAEAAGLRLQGQRSPRDQLLRFLQAGVRLIVLDNMEHLLEGADLISEMLDAAPYVSLLVTSREVLGLDERNYRVEPLPPPERNAVADDSAAVQLFIDRARQVRHDFDGDAERPAIGEICRAAGGMPLALAVTLHPDVVLLDLLLPDSDGLEVAGRLLALEHPPRVLVLTGAGGHDRVRDAIRAGVIGYLLKDVGYVELVRAIEDAAAGRPALHPDVQRYLMQQSSTGSDPARLTSLTKREHDLMRCLARGLTNRQIAAELGLTHGTVKVSVSALFDKLGAADATQAALVAARFVAERR